MRKQDRIARSQEQNRPDRESERRQQPQQGEDRERMRGSASPDEPPKPKREPGRLPLPD